MPKATTTDDVSKILMPLGEEEERESMPLGTFLHGARIEYEWGKVTIDGEFRGEIRKLSMTTSGVDDPITENSVLYTLTQVGSPRGRTAVIHPGAEQLMIKKLVRFPNAFSQLLKSKFVSPLRDPTTGKNVGIVFTTLLLDDARDVSAEALKVFEKVCAQLRASRFASVVYYDTTVDRLEKAFPQHLHPVFRKAAWTLDTQFWDKHSGAIKCVTFRPDVTFDTFYDACCDQRQTLLERREQLAPERAQRAEEQAAREVAKKMEELAAAQRDYAVKKAINAALSGKAARSQAAVAHKRASPI